MQTVYLVSYYFAPLGRADGVNRAYLVKYLVEAGWKFEVISGSQYHSLVLSFQQDPSVMDIIPDSVKIHRFESDRNWLLYDMKKILNVKKNLRDHWIKEAEQKFIPREKGIFMAVVPPVDNAFLAYRLARKHHCPFALYYPDDVLDVPASIVQQADAIFCVTPEIKQSLEKTYGHPNVTVIEHGLPDLIVCPAPTNIQGPIKMVYAGSFTFRTRPELAGKAYLKLKKISPEKAKGLTIDFYGPQGYYLWFFLRPYLNDHVCYKGYLPFKQLMNILPAYDMALTINHADVSFPSKVYHYLNACLPIFAITEHLGLIDFIRTNDIGIVTSLNPDEILSQFIRLVSEKKHLAQWRNNVLQVRERCHLRTRFQKMSEALKQIMHHH